MIDACASCLRRSHLVAYLAGDVERLLPPGRPARADVLEAGDEALLAAVPQHRADAARRFLGALSAARLRETMSAAGVQAACAHGDAYPPALRELAQPPPVLYANRLDRLPEPDRPAAAVVGSRRPSEYGRSVAYALGRGLGASGVPVVSGLALGIDALAHSGCLDAGGPTVAVVANGVDVAYPRSNRSLHERIRADGALVSELPPGARPRRWLFPARNRIMAALGRVTVVVEAGERSGTLITAGFAADLGRDVGAVPGPVTAPGAAGTNALLRQGAALVAGAQDVLDLLYGVGARSATAVSEPPPDGDEGAVLELVRLGASIDEMAERSGLPAARLRAALAGLELRGLVRRALSGSYVPTV